MRRIRKRKCRHCGDYFLPDRRNVKRQKFCSKPECRKASKKNSQRKWLQKPENRDYFRGPLNVKRVQQWRNDHPGYWRKKQDALQDTLPENTKQNRKDKACLSVDGTGMSVALQDFLSVQAPVLLGLIANFTGAALQDDIVMTIRRMQKLGMDILNGSTTSKGGQYDQEASCMSKTHPQDPGAIQLGGSASGP